VYYVPSPSHPTWFDHSNIWWRVETGLLMQFIPAPADPSGHMVRGMGLDRLEAETMGTNPT
jgi:hypothetical protein